MTEAFLHYIWQHQLIADRLTTTDGQPVVCLRAGELNRDSGPDFFNTRLVIGGVEWAGNVEVHIKSSDWRAHHHSADPAYNNVVLHVVYCHDAEIRLQNGKTPPTLELKRFLHPSLVANYDSLMAPSQGTVPCAKQMSCVPGFVVASTLERLAAERIESKSETVRRMLDESNGDLERTCYWLMARYFGGKTNALPFELLAKATDQRLLARWRDNPQRLEALLMGQAGLLEGYFDDEYPRQLQADYASLRAGASMQPIDGSLWRFHRIRPSSFPTIRISQFAQLVNQSKGLFATLLEMTATKDIERLFDQQASSYWENHYQFDRQSQRTSAKRIGKMQARLIVINAWIPLLFVYGVVHGQQKYKDQALGLMAQLPPEDNAVIRQWRQIGIEPASAAESQALLQLSHNYCSSRRCLECRIGYNILKHS